MSRSLEPEKYGWLSQVFQAASLTSSRKLASAASSRWKARGARAEPDGWSLEAPEESPIRSECGISTSTNSLPHLFSAFPNLTWVRLHWIDARWRHLRSFHHAQPRTVRRAT